MGNTAQPSVAVIIPELIPDVIRKDIALSVYNAALQCKRDRMNDPELERRAQELYDAYLQRKADRERSE